jgi:hypothetical protein
METAMIDTLNTPQHILGSIRGVAGRMERVDTVLGSSREQAFADAISGLLAHGNPDLAGLSEVLLAKAPDLNAHVFTLLSSASCELETGWNALRLGNIPAAYRQGRVASEFVGMAVLASVPRAWLEQLPPGETPLPSLLKNHPTKSVIELWTPEKRIENGQEVFAPALFQAMSVLRPFLKILAHNLGVPAAAVDNIRGYLKEVQHPSSHGSAETRAHQLLGASGGVVGINYVTERDPLYRQAADDLIHMTQNFAEILAKLHLALKGSVTAAAAAGAGGAQ